MLLMIVGNSCPYCAEAKKNLQIHLEKSPEIRGMPIKIIPENDETRREWDYYYVPAYFWDKEKISEGSYTEQEVGEVLYKAYVLFEIGKNNPKKESVE